MLYIYTSEKTRRVEYTMNFIFNNVLQLKYELTTDIEWCEMSDLPFINYSANKSKKGFWIPTINELLFQEGLSKISPIVGKWESMPTIFATNEGDVPFDLPAAVFYLISRYEEYNSSDIDNHGRFDFNASIAFRNNFLDRPLVDEWILKLGNLLKIKFPNLPIETSHYNAISTIDVDHAYRYLAKSKLQMFAKTLFNCIKLDFTEAAKTVRVLLHIDQDPYYQFEYLERIHKKNGSKFILFAHVGPIGKYDRKTIYPLRKFYRYLHNHHKSGIVGLHPSYKASLDQKAIVTEKSKLEIKVKNKLTFTRHHFLKIHIPDTFQILNQVGFEHDFSLGYAGMYGFRASTCHSFSFYDASKDMELKIKIHPTIIMDATMNFYLKMKPKEALSIGKELVDKCKSAHGDFVMLWHNNSVNNLYEWKGWQPVFEELLDYSNPSSTVHQQ